VALAAGGLVTLAAAIALVPDHGVTGAALAALAGEAVAVVLVIARLDRFRASGARRSLLSPVALTVAVAATLVLLPGEARVVAMAIVAVASIVGAVRARDVLHARL